MRGDEQRVSSKVGLTNKSLLPLFLEKSGGSRKIVSTQPGMGNYEFITWNYPSFVNTSLKIYLSILLSTLQEARCDRFFLRQISPLGKLGNAAKSST